MPRANRAQRRPVPPGHPRPCVLAQLGRNQPIVVPWEDGDQLDDDEAEQRRRNPGDHADAMRAIWSLLAKIDKTSADLA